MIINFQFIFSSPMASPTNLSEIFVVPILQSALNLLTSHIKKQPQSSSSSSSSVHIHSQVSKLQQSLDSLLQILQKYPSSSSQESESALLLKDAAWAADDLADELEYESLRREIEELARSQQNEPIAGPSTSQFKGFQTGELDKARTLISVPVVVNPQSAAEVDVVGAQDASFQDNIDNRITNIVEKLDYIAAQLEHAIDHRVDDGGDNEVSHGAVTREEFDGFPRTKGSESFLSKLKSLISRLSKMCKCLGDNDGGGFGDDAVINGEVYGRYREKERLVKMLLDPGEENVSVIPIIGNGGIGKTTLAHCVYTDERVENHFHTREWVCASDTFDMMRIAGELEESLYLSGPFDQHQLLDLYERNLMAELKGKRFLLVLDDVRSIECALRFAAMDSDVKGGKILLTTREEQVVDEDSKRNMILLEGIEDKEFWPLFKKCSIGDDDPSRHPELVNIGKQIARKLRGSPLAAKMVGALLREKLDSAHWISILRSELCGIGRACGSSGNVIAYLRLSYKYLPIHLQRCFAYCSVFPKGYAFQIDKLVYMWMAQGLIQYASRMEDIGREYFNGLLSRSFFELPCYTKSYWRLKYYLMHELLHDLAISVCPKDYLVYEGKDLGGNQKGICPSSASLWATLNSGFEWNNFRTLVINTRHVTELELLKRVRVLDLSHSYMTQLPDPIGCLIHLRYLNLSGNYIYSLPESLCKLHHLQSLLAPHKCQRLPKGITQLVSLRHLNASDEAISWIAGIGRLAHLQELNAFYVRKVKGHDIGQLNGMKELQGRLCIQYLDDVKAKEDPLETDLKNKIDIKALQLKWMRWNRNRQADSHENVLECLQPPLGLEDLEIHWYWGTRSPCWLREQLLQNLRVIYLRGCKRWKRLPSLGLLPSLEFLKLEEMDAVLVGINMFPSLRELWLVDTSVSFECMQMSPEQRQKHFPCLYKLHVQNCKRVEGLPPLSALQTLKELNLRKCSDLDFEMPHCLINLTSLLTLKISELQLTNFPGALLQWLEHLEIDSCENLTSWLANENDEGKLSSLVSLSITNTQLPTGPVLKHLTSLHELKLNCCSALMSFTVEQHKWFKELTVLRELSITDCKNLKTLPRDLHCLPSLVKLTVAGCPALRSLPSGLPISLRTLEFSNCNPGLTAQWQGRRAPDWVKNVSFTCIV